MDIFLKNGRMITMFESLKLSDIPRRQCGILRKPTKTSPVIWVIKENEVNAVVKDFSLNGFMFRNTIGRLLIWREKKAYEKLKGIHGVPNLFRSVKGLALVIEAIQGKNMESPEAIKKLDDKFFHDLRSLVEKIHHRGLAHCDLKRAPNILLGDDGQPYIIDWAASISWREFRFFPLNLIYRRFIRDDLNAIIKIRLKYFPDRVSNKEKAFYARRSKTERLIRSIRDKGRRFLKKIA